MNESSVATAEHDSHAVIVERAVPADAEAIMTIKLNAWLGAYVNEAEGVTADDLRKKFGDLPTAIANWKRGIASETEHSDRATFVAKVDGHVVGFAAPCNEGGQRRVGDLYVSPDAQGKGVGSKLLHKAVEWHGADRDVYLHVVDYNQRAIRFYEHNGFQATGVVIPGGFGEEHGIKLLSNIEMLHKNSSMA
jgi:GNAT superfamily N-acetyltransferase